MMNKMVMFDTTHHAMWAEEVARGEGLSVDVVPAPESSDAKCGLAIELGEAALPMFVAALEREGIPHRLL